MVNEEKGRKWKLEVNIGFVKKGKFTEGEGDERLENNALVLMNKKRVKSGCQYWVCQEGKRM